MNASIRKSANQGKYAKWQRNTLIVCVVIMVTYVVLVYLVAQGSFWEFATAHVALMAVAIISILIDSVPKAVTYIVLSLSLAGAGTALGVMLYYFTILNNLANG